MGTQKNCLNETVLLSTQNICLNLCVTKYLQFMLKNFAYLSLCFETYNLVYEVFTLVVLEVIDKVDM